LATNFEGRLSHKHTLFHVAPHIELVYRIWNENQSELFNFLPFETINLAVFLDLKSPLQKVGIIMSKNNYTCFHNQVITFFKSPNWQI